MISISSSLTFFILALAASDARHSKCIPVCPDCVFGPQDTYVQFAMRYLNGHGPADAPCLSGTKWIHYGRDYGLPNNACCCLHGPISEPIDCGPDNSSPMCPHALALGMDEPIGHFYQRIGRNVRGAPANGCCPEGTFKWIFDKESTGAEADICSCITQNSLAGRDVDWRDES